MPVTKGTSGAENGSRDVVFEDERRFVRPQRSASRFFNKPDDVARLK